MTSVQLATMSTGLWVVATVSVFILLAGWSSGESWGLTAAIVRGVRGWADEDRPAPTVTSPFVEPLSPLLVAKGPIGGAAAARLPIAARAPAAGTLAVGPSDVGPLPTAEVVDLGERRLPR